MPVKNLAGVYWNGNAQSVASQWPASLQVNARRLAANCAALTLVEESLSPREPYSLRYSYSAIAPGCEER